MRAASVWWPNSLIYGEDLRSLGDLILKIIFNVFPLRYQVIHTQYSGLIFYDLSEPHSTRSNIYCILYIYHHNYSYGSLGILTLLEREAYKGLLSEGINEVYLYSTVLVTHGIVSILLAPCSLMRSNLNIDHCFTF